MSKKNNKKQDTKTLKVKNEVLKRIHSTTFLLNDKEKEALESYCKKYKVKNKSRFFRETIMKIIIERFINDYPKLFD